MVSPLRSGFVAINQVQIAPPSQVLSTQPISDSIEQETVLSHAVVGGHLPVYSATSLRRSRRGLKRRAPLEDEIWYNY